jgi:ParB/RepB/Spo0J family partition protein
LEGLLLVIIHVAQITIKDRLREEIEDGKKTISDLAESIHNHGLLYPLIVEDNDDGGYNLVSGERRYLAITKLYGQGKTIKDLDLGSVRVELKNDLTDETRLMIEFEENERRKDFTWQERAKYVRKLHEMMVKKHGVKTWTQEMSARLMNVTPATISYYLDLDKTMEKHPEVAKAETMQAAIKRARVAKIRDTRRIAVDKNAPEKVKRAEEMLHHGDAREWIKSIPDCSVDLVNFDPPWGEEASHKVAENWASFVDTTEHSDELITSLLPEILRVLKPDRFCLFWYRTWAYNQMAELCESFGYSLKGSRTPCIWYKPDKISDQMRFPEKQLIDSYETFLLLRKGDPIFYEKEVQNVFVEVRVPRSALVHPTEKPVSLMERMVRLCTVPGELVLDPCAGSSSTLHAAYRAKRLSKGCEKEKRFHDAGIVRLTSVIS